MYDLLYVGIFTVFIAAAFGYVRLCDRIVEADRPPADASTESDRPADADADTELTAVTA